LRPSPLTHPPIKSHFHHPLPLRTGQPPANQHTFIITLYYSYRPLVAFLLFVVTSLNVVRFPKAHAKSFVVSCIIIFSPLFLHLSFARYPTHHTHTPYTIYTSLPPTYALLSYLLFHCRRVTIAHRLASSVGFPSIHPSIPSLLHTPNIPLHNHIYTLSLSLTLYLIFLPSTLLPPPSGLGCCFPFLLPFFHRYSSNMSTCPLTSSKVLTQSRTPDFLRSLMISPYTIPTGFFYTLRALPFFHSIRSVLSFTFDVTSFS